jgi:uncharacterized OsmC-like protein
MTTVSNGVNVQALLDAREALKSAPEAAQFAWRAKSRWQNGVHSQTTVEGNHDIRGMLGVDSDVRNGFNDVKVTFTIDADASKQEIEALVAQSQKRSAVFDALTNPTNVTVEVA